MPQITQGYEAPQNLGLNPSETGVESVAGAARRIGMFYNQKADSLNQLGSEVRGAIGDVGQVAVDYMDHREISAGAAHGAQLISNLNDAWNKKLKDPNFDPNDAGAAQKFREETLEPALEQFQQGFNTEKSQAWAEHFVDQYRQHMFQKTAADMSTMAGIAAKVNAEKTINSLSSAVASDPSSLDFALKSVDHSLGSVVDSSPTMDATTAASVKSELSQKAKENIVKSAISGMITKNPNVNLDSIQKKYGEYINGAEMKMFQKAAQTQAKVDMLQQKQLEAYQRQQQEHAASDELDKVLTNNVTADANGKLTIKPEALQQTLDIAKKYPQAGPAHARAMIDWIEAQQNKELKPIDNSAVVKDLNDRLFDPDKPLTQIDLMHARTKGDITDHTYTQLNGMLKELEATPLKGPIYQDTMKAVHGDLVLSGQLGIPGKDNVGERNYAKFMQSFVPQYLSKYRSGTLEPNALDVNDPNSMISKTMAPFKRTTSDRMRDYLAGAAGLGAPGAAPAPAKREDVMPAIPPANERPPGLYETPRGKLRWTGTGWVNP